MSNAVNPIPEGMHSVTPHLCCDGAAAAIDFYERAFGARSSGAMKGPDGKVMHAQIRIGDSQLMLVDEYPEQGMVGPRALKGTPVVLHLYVEDCDGLFARAVGAGAKAIMPPADMFWGDRYGVLEDPFGHRWSIATHKRDVSPEEMQQAVKAFDPSCEKK
jgi:PhnB protein